MIKFPSVEHFRKIVKEVVTSSRPNNIPTLSFTGTVKLHGVNVGVLFDVDENQEIIHITAQSRNNELSIEKDHYGFCAFTQQPLTLEFLKETANKIIQESSKPVDKIVVFGEFCGKSIQSKVAIKELDRMFVVFDILILYKDGVQKYQPEFMSLFENSEIHVFNINMFKTWHLDINFNHPEKAHSQTFKIFLKSLGLKEDEQYKLLISENVQNWINKVQYVIDENIKQNNIHNILLYNYQ